MQFSRCIHPFIKSPGSHLLSHTVSSIVSSAVRVLTIVFGMGTGVTPGRIAAGKSPYGVEPLSDSLMSPDLPYRLNNTTNTYFFTLRKEVIQPHLPIRLPCYDFTPIIDSTFDRCLN